MADSVVAPVSDGVVVVVADCVLVAVADCVVVAVADWIPVGDIAPIAGSVGAPLGLGDTKEAHRYQQYCSASLALGNPCHRMGTQRRTQLPALNE